MPVWRTTLTIIWAVLLGSLAWAQPVTGAGSSAAAPIYHSWAAAYAQATGTVVEYAPLGSSQGIEKIRTGTVSFGASDVALPAQELRAYGLVTFPVAVTGIALVYNLPGVDTGALQLTGEVLSSIFRGEITRWNAPAIAALNPSLALPNVPITVVVRADGSGTTYNFADYLSKVSPTWKRSHGVATHLAWPQNFLGVRGSQAVAETVHNTPYSVAYIDHSYARQHALSTARLQNAAGQFLLPSMEGFRRALMHSLWMTQGSFSSTLTDIQGLDAWPITMGTFIVLPRISQQPQETLAALQFFTWAFLNGDTLVQKNDFVRLPNQVQATAFKIMTSVRNAEGQPLHWQVLGSPTPKLAQR